MAWSCERCTFNNYSGQISRLVAQYGPEPSAAQQSVGDKDSAPAVGSDSNTPVVPVSPVADTETPLELMSATALSTVQSMPAINIYPPSSHFCHPLTRVVLQCVEDAPVEPRSGWFKRLRGGKGKAAHRRWYQISGRMLSSYKKQVGKMDVFVWGIFA